MPAEIFLPGIKVIGAVNKLNILSIKIKKATILLRVTSFVNVNYSCRLHGDRRYEPTYGGRLHGGRR